MSPFIHFCTLPYSYPPPSILDSYRQRAVAQGLCLCLLVSLVGPRCLAACKIIKGQSQPPPDGTHLYSDELFPHSQSNPTLMSYSVVNKLADKHKHGRVQTDVHIHRGRHVHTPWATQAKAHIHIHTHIYTLGRVASLSVVEYNSFACVLKSVLSA